MKKSRSECGICGVVGAEGHEQVEGFRRKTGILRIGGAKSGAIDEQGTSMDEERLQRICFAWPDLPPAIQTAISAIVETSVRARGS
jgi:hypothetical protein